MTHFLPPLFLSILFAVTRSGDAASPFTPGSVVALRVGDGAAPMTGVAIAAFLDEYSLASGTLLQSMALSGDRPVTCSLLGGSYTQGGMTASADGSLLAIPCFSVALGSLIDGASPRNALAVAPSGALSDRNYTRSATSNALAALRNGDFFWGTSIYGIYAVAPREELRSMFQEPIRVRTGTQEWRGSTERCTR